MAAITSPGTGSGLDVNAIVTQLMQAESGPKTTQLNNKEARYQVQLSALGTFKSSLSTFQSSLSSLKDLEDFQSRKTSSSDEDVFTATAGDKAVPGDYEVEVLQLASSHKIASGDFSDSGASVGEGTLKISVGTASFDVVVDEDNDSLKGVRDAINDETKNTGVKASIVNVDDGSGGTVSRLVLTSEKMGEDNAIKVEVTDDDGNNTDANGLSRLASDHFSELRPAQDSKVKVDGLTITQSNNTVENAIDGISFSLKKAVPGTVERLEVTTDTSKVKESVSKFVEAYNTMATEIDTLTKYNSDNPNGSGALLGDSTVRSVENSLRRIMGDSVDNGSIYNTLAAIGVKSTNEGKLEIDSGKLDAAIDKDLKAVGQLFAGDDGLAARMDKAIEPFIASDGAIETRTEGLNQRIKDLATERENLATRLERSEARYRAQFLALDKTVSSLRNTQNYLTSQLANLPGFVKKS